MVVVYIVKFRIDGKEAINHSNQIYVANKTLPSIKGFEIGIFVLFKSQILAYEDINFILTQIYVSIGSFFITSNSETTLIKISEFVGIITQKFSS